MNATTGRHADYSEMKPGGSARVCPSFWDRKQASIAFTAFKDILLEPEIMDIDDERLNRLFRLAAIEAEALAWQTPYPFLLFPVLLEEKLDEVRRYSHQQALYQQKDCDCLRR